MKLLVCAYLCSCIPQGVWLGHSELSPHVWDTTHLCCQVLLGCTSVRVRLSRCSHHQRTSQSK